MTRYADMTDEEKCAFLTERSQRWGIPEDASSHHDQRCPIHTVHIPNPPTIYPVP